MKLIVFYTMATLLYLVGMAFLIWEYKHSTVERRRELETVPMIMAGTALYFVAILKTHQLSLMFSMYVPT